MGKFLDYQGLTYYDEKIKDYIDEHGGEGSREVHIGTDTPTGDEVIWINPNGEVIEPATKSYVDEQVATKSTVSVGSTGTSTDEVQYITINGIEKKLSGTSYIAGDGISINSDNELNVLVDDETIIINSDGLLEAIGGGGSDLPEYPTNDGNYSLVLTMVEGVGTLAWQSISGVWQLPTQIANDLRIFQCATINKINNRLEVY